MTDIDKIYSGHLNEYLNLLSQTRKIKIKMEIFIEKKYGLELTVKIFNDELNYLNEKNGMEKISLYKDDISNQGDSRKKRNSITKGILNFFGFGKKNNNQNSNRTENSEKKSKEMKNDIKITPQIFHKSNTINEEVAIVSKKKFQKKQSFFFSPLKKSNLGISKEEIIIKEIMKFNDEICELEIKIEGLNFELLQSVKYNLFQFF